MEEIGKEEGKVIEEEGLNQTHDHAQLEGAQEPKPNSVDSVIVEMQKLIGDSGVEMPSAIEGPVDSAPTAEIFADTNNEMQGGSDKVVSDMDSDVHRESEVCLKVVSDKVVSNAESDMHCEGEVCLRVESDKVVSNAESDVHCEGEVCLKFESDKVVSNVESDVHCETEVCLKVEGDNVVENVDSDVQRESEVCVENVSEEKSEKGEEVKLSKAVELDGGAQTGDLDSNGDQTAQNTMETEKKDNDGKEGKALKDGVTSKANPSNEAHTNAETDVVVSRVEPDMCCDSEVAKEKLTDGARSKANPSSKPLTSAETDCVYGKLENYMPRDSKTAKEKLVDAVSRKAKRSPSGPHSIVKQLKANNVCKVERGMPQDNEVSMETESESDDDDEKGHAITGRLSSKTKFSLHQQLSKPKFHVEREVGMKSLGTERTFLLDPDEEGDESGTEEEQAEFMKEVDNFYKEKHMEFKPPKFYKEELNLLKLWRAVIKLGGYEKVTACKLWRQVGESFNPPKTCTTVSWTFRIFYEKALLEFEKHRWHGSELALPEPSRVEIRADGSQTCGSGRTLRDAAARAMQGWHSQRLLGNGEEKPLSTMPKIDKPLKSSGLLKRKKLSPGDYAAQVTDMRATKPRLDMTVFDIGPPADWVKINVKRFSDCFEVYALVPGLLREEVHVQSDPIGRLIISGQPLQLDNPWGVTPFKKVVSLPSRIDPHQTSAVVTLNGQLFVRVPFEQSDY
ncbi:PREDICTED: AT-rich interactive domain-containing protein 3-like isoform X1 [Fragaria vesca subsp. vesca]|uniref:AT-rich interactive domain-containing protein 3-like isoform X1 n=1 Tax=Fragaria vesca subsp. vesca TaxID=101020 RepID=UPI0002C306AC|nr:PREDICTED: AT-rich interactive domain-containing protein 3-like isoform X1 [Fragaria vesca subsp. vesca]